MMQLFKPKPSLEIAAQELIFRWIAVWSGHTASPSDGCIIVRGDDKKQVARLSGHQIKPLVEAVINGRHALKTDLLKDRIERLEHLLGCLKACEKAVAALDPNDIMALSKISADATQLEEVKPR
jgi:hypothetical protein